MDPLGIVDDRDIVLKVCEPGIRIEQICPNYGEPAGHPKPTGSTNYRDFSDRVRSPVPSEDAEEASVVPPLCEPKVHGHDQTELGLIVCAG